MAKLLWMLLLLQAWQALGATVKYDDDFAFVNQWKEIELEIEEAVTHLRSGRGDYSEMVGTQSRRLAHVIEGILGRLHQETIDHEQGDIIFRRVLAVFQQVVDALNRADGDGGLSATIYGLETVMEHMEQLVFIAKTYCPQLRALLRSILPEFLDFVGGFRSPNGILEKDVVFYESPQRMVGQIGVITEQITELLQTCNHEEEMRLTLRGYIRYLEEIIHKLEDKSFGEDETDAALRRLADELRNMFVPLMKMLMQEVRVDKNQLINHFYALNDVFNIFLEVLTAAGGSTASREFMEKIIYFYYYAIKQTHFEVRMAYKRSFYGREYSSEIFDWENSAKDVDLDLKSPEELVLRIYKLVQRFDGAQHHVVAFLQVLEYVSDKIAKEIRIHRLPFLENTMQALYVELKNMKANLGGGNVEPSEFVRCVRKVLTDLYKIVLVEKMQEDGYEHLLLKDICIKFYNFLSDSLYKLDMVDEVLRPRYKDEYVRKPKLVVIKLIKY